MKTIAKLSIVMVACALFTTQNTYAQNGKKLAKAVGAAVKMVQQNQQPQQLKQAPKAMVIQEPGYQTMPYVAPPAEPPVRLGFSGTITCEGMRVVNVIWGSYAQQLGLETGDIITHINGQKVTSLARYQQLLHYAVDHDHGHLVLRIKNVRAQWDPYAQTYVKRHIDLPHDHYEAIVPASPVTPGL